jgi:hypothetical protein
MAGRGLLNASVRSPPLLVVSARLLATATGSDWPAQLQARAGGVSAHETAGSGGMAGRGGRQGREKRRLLSPAQLSCSHPVAADSRRTFALPLACCIAVCSRAPVGRLSKLEEGKVSRGGGGGGAGRGKGTRQKGSDSCSGWSRTASRAALCLSFITWLHACMNNSAPWPLIARCCSRSRLTCGCRVHCPTR